MDVVIYGFGPIGRLIAECCLKRGIDVVGAVDINPEITGKKLSDFGIDSDAPIKESLDFKGDLVFLSTGSFLDRIYPQITNCLEKGFNVLSTCETLSYPEYRYPELAKKLDAIAKQYGKTILGTGINPGFLLDTLPIVLSASSTLLDSIKAARYIDPLKRRKSFQKKIGIGMHVEDAERKLKEGEITGHIGYAESVALICEATKFKPASAPSAQGIERRRMKAGGVKFSWAVRLTWAAGGASSSSTLSPLRRPMA